MFLISKDREVGTVKTTTKLCTSETYDITQCDEKHC